MAKTKARVKVPKQVKKGEVFQVKTLISHKMETGQRKDKKTGMKIPRMIINSFVCNYNGKKVFDCDWGAAIAARRPDITMEMVDAFLTKMYRTDADFVFTVTRDFVRNCQTPILVLPDDVPAHPYAVAMESAMLAPNSQVSIYPWKEPRERIPLAVRHIRSFLRAHRPA